MLASFPEKKALVYFSGGVSRNGLDNEAQLQAAINAATKANLAIYSIDTRGLTADPPGGGASKGGSRGAGIFNGSVVNSQRSSQLASQDTLFTLAAETGGKSFFDSNDIALGIALLSGGLLQHQRCGGRQVPQDLSETEQSQTCGKIGASRRLLRG